MQDCFKLMEVLAGCQTFEEARIAVVKECIAQLETEHATLSFRKHDPEYINYKESLDTSVKTLEDQIQHYKDVLNTIQGGPDGRG